MTNFRNPNRRFRRRRPIKDYCDIRFNGDLEGTIEYLAEKIEVVASEAKQRHKSRGRDRAHKSLDPIEVFREFVRINWTAHCDKIDFQKAFRADRTRQHHLFIAVEQYLFDIVKNHFRKREYRIAEAHIRYTEKTIYGLRTDRVRRFLENQAKRKPCENPSWFERAVDEAMRLTDEGRHCSADKRFKEILSFENGSDAHWDYLEWHSTPEMTNFECTLLSKSCEATRTLFEQVIASPTPQAAQEAWDRAHEADPAFDMSSNMSFHYGHEWMFGENLDQARTFLRFLQGDQYARVRKDIERALGSAT